MKHDHILPIMALALAIAVTACKQEGLQLYDQDSTGSSVYFSEAIGAQSEIVKEISFGYVGYTIQDSIVSVPVTITGSPSSQDRPYQLTVTEATTAVQNTHYVFLNEPVIRAGEVADTIQIKINRTADMLESQFEVDLLLESNDFFFTRLVDTSTIYLKYKILLDDIAGVSHLWTTSSRASAVLSYFGEYSRKKVDLMIEVIQIDPAFFYDSASPTPTATQILSYSRYMFYWLNKEAAEGRVYLDENGEIITMGALAG